jgi:vacuolar-type H+-ATPase subunit F/Vma7
MSVRVLCTSALAPGFALAGLAVDTADASAAAEALRGLAAQPQVGVVLIEDRLYRALPTELLKRLDRNATPIVAPFPSPAWDERSVAEEYVLEILRQAIGYRVRPR